MNGACMVAWTRPQAEYTTAERFIDAGYGAFVPSIRVRRPVRWFRNRGDGKSREMTTLEPAFSRYILFETTADEPFWQSALHLQGVLAIVRTTGEQQIPARLPAAVAALLRGPAGDGVIEDLTTMVDGLVRYARDERVRITSGPFADLPGIVIGHEGRRVRVLLSILNRQSEVLVLPTLLEKLA
jgi:transcription antitermination factor NusG